MDIKVKPTKKDKLHQKTKEFLKNPARVIVGSFALIIFIGTLLLMLPISTRDLSGAKFLDALFTATSATCVTGLVVQDTYTYFSTFGHIVILLLIQLGGLGLVTITTFFTIALRKKIGLKTIHLAQESVNSDNVSSTSHLLHWIIKLTFSIELVGAIILATVFVPEFGADGIFMSIFISISAYCNAGFDLLGGLGKYSSLTHYHDNPVVLITIMLLIVIGGFGFIVWQDLWTYKKRKKIMTQSKIVLLATGILIFLGATIVGFIEWNNPLTIGDMPIWQKVLNSIFHSISCRTAGFNTFPMESMDSTSKLVSSLLMFIGAAPGSTGGGIKVTTLVVLVMTVVCALRGKSDTIIFNRKVHTFTVYKSISIAFIGIFVVCLATSFISLTPHIGHTSVRDVDALFETISAFATVGLSVGVTSIANVASRVLLIGTMFLGRVGPISLALSLVLKNTDDRKKIIPEAKIMVG